MESNFLKVFKKTPWIRVICFFLILFVLISAVQYALLYRDRKTDNSSYQIIDYYNEKKNSLDVVFIGSSCCFSFYSPLFAYNAYGIKTANFASSGMGMLAFKYAVEEVKKTQADAPIVITLSDQDEMEYKSLHYLADYMPMSSTRLKLILSYFSKEGESILNSAEYFFPLMRFHERWSEITIDDLIVNDGTKGATRHEYYLDYITDINNDYYLSDEKLDYPESWEKHISELLDYCDEKKYEVMFMIPPKSFKEDKYKMMNSLVNMIENRGYYVLDLRDKTDDMGLDLAYDYYDKYHTNIHGSVKFTDYVINKVADRYGIELNQEEDKEFSDAFAKYYEIVGHKLIEDELDMTNRDYHLERPKLLSVSKNDKGVCLKWNEVDGADGYDVYRKEDNEWVKVADASGNEYVDTRYLNGDNTYTVFSYRNDNGIKKYGNYDYEGINIKVED